jgi:drug/metabolite transporter (DMT)-like permease
MPQLVVVSLLWAFSFGLIKRYLVGVDAGLLAWARLVLAWLVFAPWLRPSLVTRRDIAALGAIGAVQYGVMYLAYLTAFRYLRASEVALFTALTPLYVAMIGQWLDKSAGGRPLVAALVSVGAAALVMGGADYHRESVKGFVLVQASNVAFAAGQVLYRRRLPASARDRERSVFGWLYLGGAAALAPWLLIRTPDVPRLSLAGGLVVAYLGIVASGVGFFLWNAGARRTTIGTLAVMNDAKVPLGVLASVLVFDEHLTRAQLGKLIASLALMTAAVAWGERGGARAAASKRRA